ncbi:MAG TPA: hypothetical protein VFM24_00275 [Nitrospira sp.]|nr:hypothetical protein [Nitrospira sp.]
MGIFAVTQAVTAVRRRALKLTPTACLIGCTISAVTWWAAYPGWAQTMGDEAELERLRVKAEDAMASDDPEGAAMAMGRAAMMAKRLSVVHRNDGTSARLYQGAEALFRSQEHGYRAMALFRRAGGQLPASSGVCGSLALAQGSVHHAVSDLAAGDAAPEPLKERVTRWRETADDWVTVLAAMITDYQCP